MRRRIGMLAAAVGLTAAIAGAQPGQVGLTAKAGTLGLGGDVTLGLTDTLNLRAGLSGLAYDFDVDTSDDYEAGDVAVDLTLGAAMALLDWHPGNTAFRLSGGVAFNRNEADLSSQSGETVEIGDNVYQVSDLTGDVSFRETCPYVGIGCGNAAGSSRWSFAMDFGLMFQGPPDVTLEVTASDPALQDELNRDIQEEIDDIEDALSWFRAYPVLSLGLSYRF